MLRRDWAALALAVASLAVAAASAAWPALSVLAGALLVAAVLCWASRFLARRTLVPLQGLFERPGPGQRWCASCGRPAPAEAPCAVCRTAPPIKGGKALEPGRGRRRKAA